MAYSFKRHCDIFRIHQLMRADRPPRWWSIRKTVSCVMQQPVCEAPIGQFIVGLGIEPRRGSSKEPSAILTTGDVDGSQVTRRKWEWKLNKSSNDVLQVSFYSICSKSAQFAATCQVVWRHSRSHFKSVQLSHRKDVVHRTAALYLFLYFYDQLKKNLLEILL